MSLPKRLVVIDGSTNTITTSFGIGGSLTGAAVDSAHNLVYVPHGNGVVALVDGTTNMQVGTPIIVGTNRSNCRRASDLADGCSLPTRA